MLEVIKALIRLLSSIFLLKLFLIALFILMGERESMMVKFAEV